MNDLVKIALAILIAAGVGYGFGRYVQPAKVEIKKEEVIKEVETTKKDIVIVEKETHLPDGTVIKEKKTEDKSTEVVKKEEKTKESTVTTNEKPQWKVQALAGLELGTVGPVYGAGVERRILGPFFAGVYGKTNKEVGASLSFEF